MIGMRDREYKTIEVTAAILVHQGRILIARRPAGDRLAGFWEFPGGKLEAGETARRGLQRELMEEFGIRTRIGRFYDQTEYRYDHQCVRLLVYEAEIAGGDFEPRVHDAVHWVKPHEMGRYRFAPADRPIVARLQDASGGGSV
jgi:8-oxo-dGTP diphosphatase